MRNCIIRSEADYSEPSLVHLFPENASKIMGDIFLRYLVSRFSYVVLPYLSLLMSGQGLSDHDMHIFPLYLTVSSTWRLPAPSVLLLQAEVGSL